MAKNGRTRFSFFESYWESIQLLKSNKHKALLLSAICEVSFGSKLSQNVSFSQPLLQMAWLNIKPVLEQSLNGFYNKTGKLQESPSQAPIQAPTEGPTEHKEGDKEGEGDKDKEEDKEKEVRERLPSQNSPKPTDEILSLWDLNLFEAIWIKYPVKLNKRKAMIEFSRIRPDPGKVKLMLSKIESFQNSELWENKKFIPSLANWLKDERWTDELEGEVDQARELEFQEKLRARQVKKAAEKQQEA